MKNLFLVPGFVFISVLFLGGCNTSSNSVSTISGTAATGKGIVGTVMVKDANGVEVNTVTGSDGRYTVQVPAMTPPFIIQIIPDDGSPAQYSFAAFSGQTVNITPLTTEVLYMASGNGDLQSIYSSWDGSGIEDENIKTAQKILLNNYSALLISSGLDPENVDLFSDEFETNGKGLDGVLDQLLALKTLDIQVEEINSETFPGLIDSGAITIEIIENAVPSITADVINVDQIDQPTIVIEAPNVTNNSSGDSSGVVITAGGINFTN